MRKSLAFAMSFAAILVAPVMRAQEQPLRLELYGGYGYVRFNVNARVSGQPPSQTFNANGGGGELEYNINNWFGLLGDLSGYWATNTANASSQGALVPCLLGPRLNFRHGRITPFVQVLFGGVATSSGIQTSGWQSHFAMTAGGGIDLKLSRHFAIRPFPG